MSRKLTDEQYRKTKSWKFRQWLDGTKDPYLDAVEMKPQIAYQEDKKAKHLQNHLQHGYIIRIIKKQGLFALSFFLNE